MAPADKDIAARWENGEPSIYFGSRKKASARKDRRA